MTSRLPTPRQEDCLRVIRTHVHEHGEAPSYRFMTEAMGLRSTRGVVQHVDALVRKGFLRRRQGRLYLRES